MTADSARASRTRLLPFTDVTAFTASIAFGVSLFITFHSTLSTAKLAYSQQGHRVNLPASQTSFPAFGMESLDSGCIIGLRFPTW